MRIGGWVDGLVMCALGLSLGACGKSESKSGPPPDDASTDPTRGKACEAEGWTAPAVGSEAPTPEPRALAPFGTGRATRFAFAPDDRLVATAGTSGIHLWDWRNTYPDPTRGKMAEQYPMAKLVAFLPFDADFLDELMFSDDGTRLLAANNRTLTVWRVADGAPLAVFEAPADARIDEVSASADLQYVAYSDPGPDPRIRIVHWSTGACRSIAGRAATFIPGTTNMVVFASSDHATLHYDAAAAKVLGSFPDLPLVASHRGGVSADGTRMLVGNEIYELPGGTLVKSLPALDEEGALTPDGKRVVVRVRDADRFDIWEVATGERSEVKGTALAFHVDGVHHARMETSVPLIEKGPDAGIVAILERPNRAIEDVAFTRSGDLVTINQVRERTWSSTTGRPSRARELTKERIRKQLVGVDSAGTNTAIRIAYPSIAAEALQPGGALVATFDGDSVLLLDGATTLEKATLTPEHEPRRAAFSADGTQLVVGHEKRVSVWDVAAATMARTFQTTESSLTSIAANTGATMVALGTSDGRLSVWDSGNGERVCSASASGAFVNDVLISPDGRLIATRSDDDAIRFFGLANCQLLATLVLYGDDGWLVTTPDGRIDGDATSLATIPFIVRGLEIDDRPATRKALQHAGLLAEALR